MKFVFKSVKENMLNQSLRRRNGNWQNALGRGLQFHLRLLKSTQFWHYYETSKLQNDALETSFGSLISSINIITLPMDKNSNF